MTLPVKAQTSPVQVQRQGTSVTGQTGITVTGLSAAPSPAVKAVTSSPGSSATSTSSTTVIQNVSGQNIIKQVRGRRDESELHVPVVYHHDRYACRCEKAVKGIVSRCVQVD